MNPKKNNGEPITLDYGLGGNINFGFDDVTKTPYLTITQDGKEIVKIYFRGSKGLVGIDRVQGNLGSQREIYAEHLKHPNVSQESL